ncbi:MULTISPECIES: hypothetical protein [unclassified Actinomyces]|uniref:hypothetical protein n=1 Tax=unclassified Actinomyces TaxID=2609248 RepID=UPI002017431F|nr:MULTISPECIES: hypothetical protein [unclassified Actinomyces]MCL3776994.1 hypothetical protein [Actinomyces sp. AC-20-1]MCL3789049.1 hypothetical protein [Actinomyces sp. 187325]MCL3791436.1 hypothetical protein [Actinomyces sp. 186855]MCL3794033.1 hypothetical protein [Actinomyces sp. 217892]
MLTSTVLLRDGLLKRVPAEVLLDVGGKGRFADPETALFWLQWSLNLLGQRVVILPGPAPAAPTARQARLLRRRGVLSLLDVVLGDELRGAMLPVAQVLALSGDLAAAGVDTTVLDLQRSPGGDDIGTLAVPVDGLLGAYAIDGALSSLEDLACVREEVQRLRRVPDAALAHLIGQAMDVIMGIETRAQAEQFDHLAPLFGLDRVIWEPLHVLVVAPAEGAAAERADHLLAALGADADVRRADATTGIVRHGGDALDGTVPDHTAWADVIVLIGCVLDDAPGAASIRTPLLVDLSTMDILKWLESGPRSDSRALSLSRLLRRADRVLVQDEGHRDLILGALAAAGRVNDVVYDDDPSLTGLVTVDPTGAVLEDFCRVPVRSADAGVSWDEPLEPSRPNDIALTLRYLREGGVKQVLSKASGRIRRLAAERSS